VHRRIAPSTPAASQPPRKLPATLTARSWTTELFELIENHLGKAFVKVQQAMQVQVPMMQPPSPSNP
jgi:hypothetical protein